jgi:putative membrane protein
MMKSRMFAALMLLAGCTSMSQQKWTDPQIAMVMRVANLGEVRESELARTKAVDTSVRDFAAMMVTEHTAQNNKAEAELANANINSEDTNLSRQLDATSGTAADRLRALSGSALDRAYIDRSVDAHQSLITLIDSTLMPVARKKVVRDQLTALRALADKHLTRAKQIQAALPR